MIKLETTVSALTAKATLALVSSSETPSISLSTDNARSQVNGQWVEDKAKRKQLVSYFSEDGPLELQGVVSEQEAVEMTAAYKVLLDIELFSKSLPTYEAGKVSGTLAAVRLLRVAEVWSTSKKRVYPLAIDAQVTGKTFDPSTGRVG